MDTLTIIAYALILYGILTLYIAFARPKAIWSIGKIQGFVQLLTEKGISVRAWSRYKASTFPNWRWGIANAIMGSF
jgi:hypothetical protein